MRAEKGEVSSAATKHSANTRNLQTQETLKSMRRVMPFTRSKMEWNLQAHKMVKQLHSK